MLLVLDFFPHLQKSAHFVMVHPKNSDGDTTKENNPEDETMMNIEFSRESEYRIDNLEGSVMKDKRRLSAYLFAFYLVLIMFAIGVVNCRSFHGSGHFHQTVSRL